MRLLRLPPLALVVFIPTLCIYSQNVGINTTGATPDASAMLDIVSTDKGMLIPRMTTAQRTAISSPATGLMVYDTSTGSFWYFNGTIWVEITNESTDDNGIYGGDGTTPTGTDVTITDYINFDANTFYVDGTNDKIGIGINTPGAKFEIQGSSGDENTEGVLRLQGPSGTGSSNLRMGVVTGSRSWIQSHGGLPLYINSLGNDVIMNSAGGNVGIGTTSPSEKLDLEGNLEMNDYNIYNGDDVYVNDVYNTGEEDAIEFWADLRMESSTLIDMPMNMKYSQTTTDQSFGSSYSTSRTISVTARAGQRVLLMAWANVDHDDEEVIYVRLTRDGTQIGETTTFEEDDQTGSWVDDFVVYYQWVDVPGDGTFTYDMDIRGDDGSGLTAFSASFVALVF